MEINTFSPRALTTFFQGAALPFQAAKLLAQKVKWWPLALLPLLLNLLLFTGLFYWGNLEFVEWLQDLLHHQWGDAWYAKVLAVTARVLFWLIAAVIVYFIFTPVALLIACPFNDILAERVEHFCGQAQPDNRPWWKALPAEATYALVSEAKRLVVFGAVFLVIFVIGLIPLLQAVALPLSLIWMVWAAAFEFISYAADRRHLGLRGKSGLLRQNLPAALGFGTVTTLLLLVPFLNVLMVSLSAIAGTLLFCRAEKGPKNDY